VANELRQEVVTLVENGKTKRNIAKQLNIGEATVYRILAASKK
jgi:transposase